MADGLDVRHRPHDPRGPVACRGEAGKRLVGQAVRPRPPEPRPPERVGYESVRNGTANLFVPSGPLAGWRPVTATDRRTAGHVAEGVRWLAEGASPEAERVPPAMDRLTAGEPARRCEASPPQPARRTAERADVPRTPEHGSRRNVAEVALGGLSRPCLGRRIGSADELADRVDAWPSERNDRAVGVQPRSATAEARSTSAGSTPQSSGGGPLLAHCA